MIHTLIATYPPGGKNPPTTFIFRSYRAHYDLLAIIALGFLFLKYWYTWESGLRKHKKENSNSDSQD